MQLQKVKKIAQINKCEKVEKTLERLKAAFNRMNLKYEYASREFFQGSSIFSSSLTWVGLNFETNGKGLSCKLTMASAFAEMAERISSRLHFKQITDYGADSKYKELIHKFRTFKYLKGYFYGSAKDDSFLAIEDLLKNIKISKKNIDIIKKQEISKHWVNGYSLTRDREIKVPLLLIKKISGSNGLASGNRIEEAIAQGACEIFERYVKIKIVKQKMIVPTIDKKSIRDKKIQELFGILDDANIETIVKDFSLGNEFPCIGILFINKNLKNTKNPINKAVNYKRLFVGASFNLKEALTRCIAEYAQGYTLDGFKRNKVFDIIYSDWFKAQGILYKTEDNFNNFDRSGVFTGDLMFLKKGKKKNFHSIAFRKSSDFLDDITQIKEICANNNIECIFVDQTHPVLQFPVVRIIMPGFDNVLSYRNYAKNVKNITESSSIFLSEYIEDDSWYKSKQGINKVIKKIEKHIEEEPFALSISTLGFNNRKINLIELLASLYVVVGKFTKAAVCFRILSKNYPGESEVYSRLEALSKRKEKDAVIKILGRLKGCYRFLISSLRKNPLVEWCDEPCENQCSKYYEQEVVRVIKTFFNPPQC
ncbi:MAG: YcaO-like family protein [Candidatus Omnitrophica bacterium]|nr:YcaO-like family protein [Candidatus Omnitrophota bacterium]